MIKTTVKVSGMACAMCEAHINDAVRGAFPVKKVTSNHSKGETVILSEEPLDEAAIRKTIDATVIQSEKLLPLRTRKKGFFTLALYKYNVKLYNKSKFEICDFCR